jgi:CubicO group peptidase (beta-lactamase class C family)
VVVRIVSLACCLWALSVTGLVARQTPASPSPSQPDRFAEAAKAASDLPRLHSLLASWRGEVVLERYFNGARAARAANVKSVSKSIISALVGVAIDRGLVPGPHTPIRMYFPQITKDRDDEQSQLRVVGAEPKLGATRAGTAAVCHARH